MARRKGHPRTLITSAAVLLAAVVFAVNSVAATTKPAAPTGLTVTPADGALVIAWNASSASDQVDRYQLYRNDGWTQVADVAPPATTYTMTGLANGTTYKIRVGAHNAVGYGPWSAAVSTAPVATPAPPPADPPPTTTPDPPAPPTGDSAEDRPYDPGGPVYQPMPDNAPAYKDSAAIISYVVANKRGITIDAGSESPPVYVGRASDPVYKIGAYQVHVPVGAQAGKGSDYPLVVLDPDTKTEYRMWRAKINTSTRTITYSGLGVGSYRNDGSLVNGQRALGQRMGTGSDNSYLVGMIRPQDFARGYIDHAIRTAIGYPRNNAWFWPALRTENQGYATSGLDHAPMGARIAIRSDFDLAPLNASIDASSLSAKGKAATKMILKALQRYGMIALDGTTGSHNLYLQGEPSFDWTQYLGPRNSLGSFNDIGRALVAALNLNGNAGWRAMFVADPSVFDGFGR